LYFGRHVNKNLPVFIGVRMYRADFHLHTHHSFDSRTAMADVCRQALLKNCSEICFTEHFSLNPGVPTFGHLDWNSYNADIIQNRADFHDSLIVRKGIEICEPHQDQEGYRQIFSHEPMDFILGSVHNVSTRKLRFLLRDFGKERAYACFFEETLSMVQSADMDGAAHLDLIKRYCGEKFTDQDLERNFRIIEKILKTMIERNIALEINTSTLKSLNETMPASNILLLYRSLGGTMITLGSDSHNGTSMGEGFDIVCKLALQSGFTDFCTFEQRKPVQRKIL